MESEIKKIEIKIKGRVGRFELKAREYSKKKLKIKNKKNKKGLKGIFFFCYRNIRKHRLRKGAAKVTKKLNPSSWPKTNLTIKAIARPTHSHPT